MSQSVSQTGLTLVQEYEGFRAEPAQLPDGNWVVGYGHVRIGEAGASVTEAEASDLLALDLAPVERAVNAAVTRALTQNQFDALASFAFSVGADAFTTSAVVRRVNSGELVAAACAMDAWRKSDVTGEMEIIDALVRRRAAEKALFLKGDTQAVTPSAFMRAKLDHAASILGAPVAYSQAPEVGSIPFVQKTQTTERLAEILKSEPATEAFLLTQVVAEDIADEDEIVTAHAKPVARKLEGVAALRSIPLQIVPAPASKLKQIVAKFSPKFSAVKLPRSFPQVKHPVETFGLAALFVFGLGLIALGFGQLRGHADGADVLGAAALSAPGLAAVFMASFGLMRGPQAKAA